jgi:hypothetical protein
MEATNMNKQNVKKRLLFICSDYYPPSSVFGTIMNHHIVKHLKKIGWKAVVLNTAHQEVEEAFKQFTQEQNQVFYSLPPPSPSYKTIGNLRKRKIGAHLYPIFFYMASYGAPVWQIHPKRKTFSIADNFDPQIIIATHPQPKYLLLANKIGKTNRNPWVAFMYEPKNTLIVFYQKGDIEWHPDYRAIDEFSWDKQIEKLSQILEKIIRSEHKR